MKNIQGVGLEWDEWNWMELFEENILYLVDMVDEISNSGGEKERGITLLENKRTRIFERE